MKKILIALIALFATSSVFADETSKATVSNISLSIADDETIDADGDFKVTLNYAVSINDPAIQEHSNMVSAVAQYKVYDASNNVVEDKKTTPLLSRNTRDIYVSGLESDKEYTMKVERFYVIDKSKADYETFFGDTIATLENCAELKFVPKKGEIKIAELLNMSLTNDPNALIDAEGMYAITFNYTGKINDTNINAGSLTSTIKYNVYDSQDKAVTNGTATNLSFNETLLAIKVSGLAAGQTYKMVIKSIVVKNGNTEVMNLTSALPELTFKVKDPNAPQAITISNMSFSVDDEGNKLDNEDEEDKNLYFKVTFHYTTTVNDPTSVKNPFATIEYTVVNESGMKVISTLANFDYQATTKNIYIPNLETGKTYTITATKVDIQDLETMEMLCETDKNMPTLTFTVTEEGAGISQATTTSACNTKKIIENGKVVILKNNKKHTIDALEVK